MHFVLTTRRRNAAQYNLGTSLTLSEALSTSSCWLVMSEETPNCPQSHSLPYIQTPEQDRGGMSAQSPRTDYFSINTTRIYSANPAGNFTVTSLPLTRRHLQDLESPSHYNLLFDLIANKFSKTPLHRQSYQEIAKPLEISTTRSGHQRPTLSATKSAESVLTPQRHEHQQGRGCEKLVSNDIRTTGPLPPSRNSVYCPARSQQRPQLSAPIPAKPVLPGPRRAQPRDSPYESPSQIGARSVGALLALPEHTHHNHDSEAPHRPLPISTQSTQVVLPRHNTILGNFHNQHLYATISADPIFPRNHHTPPSHPESATGFRSPQRIASRNLTSTISLPATPTMAPKSPHQLEPNSPDPFTLIGNPHRPTTLSPPSHFPSPPPKRSFFSHFSLLHRRHHGPKASRILSHDQKCQQKQKLHAERAARKRKAENAAVARRADKESNEASEKIGNLGMEAERLRGRRERQVRSMEGKRRWEEEKERVVGTDGGRGVSWGFDPGAGRRDGGERRSGGVVGATAVGEAVGEAEGGGGGREVDELGRCLRVRRGTTWGVTGGWAG